VSVRSHQHSQAHFDEFFVVVDHIQGATNIFSDIGRAALLDPLGELYDGGFECELVLVDFEKQGREQT
jgi:hypothetical protein